MGKKPKLVYSDEESSLKTDDYKLFGGRKD